MINFDSIS